jgi:hypothetical protein
VSDGNNGLIVRRPFMRRAVEQVPQTVAGGAAPVETVVVSGFRSSLEQSLDMKRRRWIPPTASWRKTSPNSRP